MGVNVSVRSDMVNFPRNYGNQRLALMSRNARSVESWAQRGWRRLAPRLILWSKRVSPSVAIAGNKHLAVAIILVLPRCEVTLKQCVPCLDRHLGKQVKVTPR